MSKSENKDIVIKTMEPNKDVLLKEWQEALLMQDWRITIEDMCSLDEMIDTSGDVTFTECHKSAHIRIIDPKYYGNRVIPFDYEKTLVHELLHLKLSLVQNDVSPLQERVVHQIIDELARSFVALKRKQSPANMGIEKQPETTVVLD